MFQFFRSIDDFLIKCEDYFDYRIKTGKFVADISFLSWLSLFKTSKKYNATTVAFFNSSFYKAAALAAARVWDLLMRIDVFENIVSIIADAIHLANKYFTEYLILFLFGMSTVFLMLLLFENFPQIFFLLFIPLILFNHLTMSGFYVFIDKKENGHAASLLEEFLPTKPNLVSSIILFLFQFACVITMILFFLGFTFLLSYLFDKVGVDWGSSFIYWAIVIFLGFVLLLGAYILNTLIYPSYYYALLEKIKPFQAFERSLKYVGKFTIQVFFFTIIHTICFLSLILYASNTFYDIGFGLSTLIAFHALFLLHFVLRRKLILRDTASSDNSLQKFYLLFKPALTFGFLSYLAIAVLVIQIHPDIIHMMQQQEEKASVNDTYISYQNKDSGYLIDYPKTWSVYRWNDKSITLYNNFTGTQTGGVWVNIDVYPVGASKYFELHERYAGLVTYDIGTQNVTTKISNIIVQGFNGVKYTYIKADGPSPEYHTHNLIHKDKLVYDIDFVTMSKTVEDYNIELFDKMIKSFRFI